MFTSNQKAALVILILSVALYLDAHLLFQSEYAVGIDGYYYVLQIDSFLNHGDFYFPRAAPFVLYILSALAFLLGNSILALKIGTLVLHALLCLSCLVLVTWITRTFWLGLLGMSILSFSNLHLFFISEFISNLGALMFLFCGGIGFLGFSRTRNKGWLIFALLGTVSAALSHRSTWGLIILISASFAISHLFLNSITRKMKIFALLIFSVLLILPLIGYWQPFFILPPVFRREILGFPESPFRQTGFPESIMIVLAVCVGLVSSIRFASEQLKSDKSVILVAILVWSLLTTFNPFLNHQAGFQGIIGRLDTLVYSQAAIAVPISLSLIHVNSKVFWSALTVVLAALLCSSFTMPIPIGIQKEFLDERMSLISQLNTGQWKFCEKPIIIAEHGKQYVVSSILGVPSQQKRPTDNIFYCTYWLIQTGGNGKRSKFSIIEDSETDRMIKQTKGEQLKELFALNSHLNYYY